MVKGFFVLLEVLPDLLKLLEKVFKDYGEHQKKTGIERSLKRDIQLINENWGKDPKWLRDFFSNHPCSVLQCEQPENGAEAVQG